MAFGVIYAFILIRYFLMVAPFYFYFWSSKRKPSALYIHQGFDRKQIFTEIKFSIISSLIFAAAGVLLGWLWQNNFTLIYLKLETQNIPYIIFSFLALTLIHEVYFYLTHRWMHRKSVFRHVHYVHHLSKNTSPWASFSFHPLEALILALFLPFVVLVLPLHPLVLIAYMVFMTVTAISNHLGVELFKNTRILDYFISGSHHASHHYHYNSNFGLYYCFMDNLFKTARTPRTE